MISVSFVNNTIKPIRVNDDINAIFNIIKESNDTIKSLINDYITESENQMMNEAVGLFIEGEDEKVLEKKSSGIFDKIGEVILAVFKKIQELISKIIRAIKDVFYKLAPVEKKLDMIKKDNPEIANKVIAEIDAGNLSVMDIKNLAEVEKAYNQILEDAKKKEVDAKTLRGKAEALKNKFDDFLSDKNGSLTKLKNIGTVITVATSIIFIKTNMDKYIKTNMDAQKASSEWFDIAKKTVQDMKKLGGDYEKALDPDLHTKAEIVANISNAMQGNFGKIVTDSNTKMKFLNGIMTKVMGYLGHDTDATKFMNAINALNND